MKKNREKSFTSLFNIFAPRPYQDVYRIQAEKDKTNTINPNHPKTCKINEDRITSFDEMPYVTSEKYHALNKIYSDKSIVQSTSTLFYDLDKLVKRHSYHCITEITAQNITEMKHDKNKHNKNIFGAKSETIVQECAAFNQPNLRMRDSIQVNANKVKKRHLTRCKLSSEICLHDKNDSKCDDLVKQEDSRQQKFWSFAKYQTEYTNPKQKEKKCKKKERGKRIEDPCPCQLFSYACPCTDKKSLTELANNSKSLTVADQITSTTKFCSEAQTNYKSIHSKNSKGNRNNCTESKLTETHLTDIKEAYEVVPVSDNQVAQIINTRCLSKGNDKRSFEKKDGNLKCKPQKKSKQIVCPNCKQKLDVTSTTEEEDFKSKDSPIFHNSAYLSQESINIKNNNDKNADICTHMPTCELVPICQILPSNNENSKCLNSIKCVENISMVKHNPKMIRITKACRHHPPCTVVPSCQRINVLKNNCEYIPPCLHRPRCVNLPLCVPASKNFFYSDINNQADEDSIDCSPLYKNINGSLNSCVGHQFHTTQNTCEYFSEYSPRLILNPQMTHVSPSYSPYMPNCKCCKSNKSCQYDCIDCNCNRLNNVEDDQTEAIVYIRDVGCQFRNKTSSPQGSLLYSKTSSTSFYFDTAKSGKYYSQYHTLRYEDKCTNPIFGEELSMSTFTSSSLEIDADCPAHGKKNTKGYTEFCPKSVTSPVIAALITDPTAYAQSILNLRNREINTDTSKSDYMNSQTVRSRRSFLKGYHKKTVNARRRKRPALKYGRKASSRRILRRKDT